MEILSNNKKKLTEITKKLKKILETENKRWEKKKRLSKKESIDFEWKLADLSWCINVIEDM